MNSEKGGAGQEADGGRGRLGRAGAAASAAQPAFRCAPPFCSAPRAAVGWCGAVAPRLGGSRRGGGRVVAPLVAGNYAVVFFSLAEVAELMLRTVAHCVLRFSVLMSGSRKLWLCCEVHVLAAFACAVGNMEAWQ